LNIEECFATAFIGSPVEEDKVHPTAAHAKDVDGIGAVPGQENIEPSGLKELLEHLADRLLIVDDKYGLRHPCILRRGPRNVVACITGEEAVS
jgi:hypothetical protein